jgi:hypothetical protein
MRFKWIMALVVCFLSFAKVGVAATKDACALPQGLDSEIAAKYPHAHIIRVADLYPQDKQLYEKDHRAQCPGLVSVNFYGDGKPTWALVLISGKDPLHIRAELLTARNVGPNWEMRSIEVTDGKPVVWSEGPGKYRSVYRDKTIQAANPVIVFCGYSSWAIVYAWNGKRIEKVWLQD